MPASAPQKLDREDALIEDIAGFFNDPLGFVYFAYPWGEPGPLLEETGPDTWQEALLDDLGKRLEAGEAPGAAVGGALQIAVASGHGVGKSALVSWIIHWFISTREHPQIVVTAGTQAQLRSKTWREVAKWWKLLINTHWFKWTATSFYHVHYPETWFASAIPWSDSSPESFAGTHEKHVLVIFDEASQIDDIIWETTEGAMTTDGAMWIVFGNPTRNTGRFAECWGKFKHRWQRYQVDSRTAKKANKAQIQNWIDDYGEDSDFVRIRVRGLFPRAGSLQLISIELVRAAMAREIPPDVYNQHAKILALDVARHGDDQSVFTKRMGLKVWPQTAMREPNTMQLADRAAAMLDDEEPEAMFVDATGMGWGVIDRLIQMGHKNVVAVEVGEVAIEKTKFSNRRMEMWWKTKEHLENGGSLPLDNELETDLIGPEYGYVRDHVMQLESKRDMKKRGLASPDKGDSLALTFTNPIQPRKDRRQDGWRGRLKQMRKRHKSPQAA